MGDHLREMDPAGVRVGDEVDIPVWFDMWFPPAGLRMAPIAFATFDRMVIISRDN